MRASVAARSASRTARTAVVFHHAISYTLRPPLAIIGSPEPIGSPGPARYVKSTEMLSRWAMRRMASPNSPATETTSTLADNATGWVSTLSVMNRR